MTADASWQRRACELHAQPAPSLKLGLGGASWPQSSLSELTKLLPGRSSRSWLSAAHRACRPWPRRRSQRWRWLRSLRALHLQLEGQLGPPHQPWKQGRTHLIRARAWAMMSKASAD